MWSKNYENRFTQCIGSLMFLHRYFVVVFIVCVFPMIPSKIVQNN